jgi:hypothetical protein
VVIQVLQELKDSQENHHSAVPKEKQVNQVRRNIAMHYVFKNKILNRM